MSNLGHIWASWLGGGFGPAEGEDNRGQEPSASGLHMRESAMDSHRTLSHGALSHCHIEHCHIEHWVTYEGQLEHTRPGLCSKTVKSKIAVLLP